MVRCTSLILMLALAGCATDGTSQAYSSAKVAAAVAAKPSSPIPMPDACKAHVDRVSPRVGEPWPVVQKRWEIVADNRDQQADDCAAWDADRIRLGAK